jgi:hypothetical protein
MSIEELVDEMSSYLKNGTIKDVPQPCSEDDIRGADLAFVRDFGVALPDAYKRVLRRANGVLHNGLIVWPAKPEPLFQETIHKANTNFRDSFSDDYLYFAQKDEELYVLNVKSNIYCAIEFVGKPIWKRFSNADDMFLFALTRAWE